ncbi:MAG: alpha/beta fold hydrolase [Desulfobulbaceae bacterium]|nr:alpha/beta fold hydrolase [Desulfobulbaceae bacterium]
MTPDTSAGLPPKTGAVLLHGLARTRRSMRPLAVYLERQGYTVVNVSYPSRRYPAETLARLALPPAVAELRRGGIESIHFVTHSMGGILLRSYLASENLPELSRVVMLSPPNQGSEVVDHLGRYFWFRWFFGPAGCQLGTAESDLPLRLGPMPCPVGIIIGTLPALGLSRFFPGPNDGKVSVARAQLAGMTDFLTLPYGHAFIMRHRPVLAQVAFFLENGRFWR